MANLFFKLPLSIFSLSRILLLDLILTSSQMNTQTLIHFLYNFTYLETMEILTYYKVLRLRERKRRLTSYFNFY